MPEDPVAGGAGVLAQQVGWRAWKDRQTDRQVRSSCSLHGTCWACLCCGSDLYSCAVQPSSFPQWVLSSCSFTAPLLPRSQMFSRSHELSQLRLGGNWAKRGGVFARKYEPRGLQWKKNQTLCFKVREGQGSDANHQTGLCPELTKLMPRQRSPVRGWGRLFTSWAFILSPFPFGATCSMLGFMPDQQGFLWGDWSLWARASPFTLQWPIM